MPLHLNCRLRRVMAALVVLLAIPLLLASARAQGSGAKDFPARTLTFVVPYAAGGPVDVTARILSEHMGRTLGQTIVVENVTGATGTIATEKVAKAAPDGLTILVHNISMLAAPALFKNLHYDTRTAFAPVGLINSGPMVIVGRKTLPAKTPDELYAWMKANGEKVTIGHAGLGSSMHMCEVLLAQAVGTKPTYVGYRGAAPALNDLIAGQIDLICDQSTNSVPQILAGNTIAFAVTSPQRIAALPTVPTVVEAGLPLVQFTVWNALFVPKGTPDAIIAKLNRALAAAVDDPAVQAKFGAVGATVYPPSQRSVAANAAVFAADLDRITKLIEGSGIKATDAK